jgi:hypothetical protein
LGFRAAAGTSAASDDVEETAAHQEEEKIERLLREGWPQAPARQVRRAATALTSQVEGGGAPAGAGEGHPPAGAETSGAASPTADGAPPAAGQATLPTARVTGTTAPPMIAGGEASKPDVDKLARQVYTILKARLRAEHDRHQVYGRT